MKSDRNSDGTGWCSPILYLSLSQYARDKGLTGADFERFMKMLRAMDGAYLTWLAEKKPTPETTK